MSEPVIRVEGLSKKYLLRHEQAQRYTALRDVVSQRVRALGRTLLGAARGTGGASGIPAREEFWALQDVSFEVRQGERIGIIGRNGAGKSTLLKILSRITEPTTGRIELEGRVASLLEVGTGFHPELTGRENIFLNGAILGMGREEIRRKFDEIVAFAEVEKFLDTPVKRYSSGMYVRLAFAVAAHLEPEILVVDEVLAVGDAPFQQKCLGRMEAVGREGRTVLFVSHNLGAVTTLCNRGIVLAEGRVIVDADASTAVGAYLGVGPSAGYERPAGKPQGAGAVIRRAWFEGADGAPAVHVVNGEPLCVVLEVENPGRTPVEAELSFWDHLRRPLWSFTHALQHLAPLPAAKRVLVRIRFAPPRLTVPEVIADLALAPRAGAPYCDHVVGAIKCTLVAREAGAFAARSADWPIFCEGQMTCEALDV